MGNGCEVAFVVLLFLSARRGARGAVFSNCEAIECACPANETCSFASTGHDEFRGGILRCPTSGEACTVYCAKKRTCKDTKVYLYGGSLTIDCTNWDENCHNLNIIVDDSTRPIVDLNCGYDITIPCLNVSITQIHSPGGSLLLDVNCQTNDSCANFTLPSNTDGSTYVRNTGTKISGAGGCPLGQWACGNSSTCISECGAVNQTFAYLSSYAPTFSVSPTFSPTILIEPTSSPISLQPFAGTANPSSNPVSTSPATNHPTSTQPSTLGPIITSPASLHPGTYHPASCHPGTSQPGTSGPLTPQPVTSSTSPASLHPATLQPGSSHPATSNPTCSPVSIHPATSQPSTGQPTNLVLSLSPSSFHPSAHPASANPLTSLPTAEPTLNPNSNSPVTQKPSTLHPATLSPASSQPLTSHPLTISPVTFSPSGSPATTTPSTLSPSLSILTVTVSHKHLSVKEDFPPWDSGSSYVFKSTDRFYVHNTEPGHTIRIDCQLSTEKVLLYHERFLEDGKSEYDRTSTIYIGDDDPTHWECLPNGNPGRVSLRCNDRDTSYSNIPEPTRCGVPELWEQSGLPRGFSCRTPCYNDTTAKGGCYGSGGLSSVGVFSVRGMYDGNATTSIPFTVTCGVDRLNSDQSSGFQLGGTKSNVYWPILKDFLIGYQGGFLSSTSQDQMSFTVATATSIVALGRKNGIHDPFDASACPVVYVGSQLALNVTCTSLNISFTTPYYRDLCGDSDDCGYFPVQIRNPDVEGKASGGVVRCPPGCPRPGLGIFYTPECTGYTSPSVCSIAALTGSTDGLECAWGAKDDCKLCHDHGFCPGGYRLWPRPGYYAHNERVTNLVLCPRPSTERCQGWHTESSTTKCGEAYTGTLCATCANGYYERLGECYKCPDGGLEKRVEKLIVLFVVLFALFLFIAGSSLLAYCRASAKMKAIGIYQAKDFVLWSFLVLQVHGLVLSSASGLTPEVKTLFSWLNIVNLDFEAVGPECFGESEPFMFETIIMAVAFSSVVINGVILEFLTFKKWIGDSTLVWTRSLLFRLSTIIYTPAAYISLSLIHCQSIPAEGGGEMLVSSHNNNYECFGDEHARPAVLALLTILTCSLWYPVWTFYILKITKEDFESSRDDEEITTPKSILRHKAAKRWKMYRYFFGDDYFPRFFWAIHVHFFVAWTLCCTLVFTTDQSDSSQGVKLVINVLVVMAEVVFLIVCSPYLPHVVWKGITKISILTVVGLNSILDFLNFLYETDRAERVGVIVLSNIVFTGAILNFLVLFIAFCLIVLKTSSWKIRMRTHFLIQMATTHDLIRMNFSLGAKSFARGKTKFKPRGITGVVSQRETQNLSKRSLNISADRTDLRRSRHNMFSKSVTFTRQDKELNGGPKLCKSMTQIISGNQRSGTVASVDRTQSQMSPQMSMRTDKNRETPGGQSWIGTPSLVLSKSYHRRILSRQSGSETKLARFDSSPDSKSRKDRKAERTIKLSLPKTSVSPADKDNLQASTRFTSRSLGTQSSSDLSRHSGSPLIAHGSRKSKPRKRVKNTGREVEKYCEKKQYLGSHHLTTVAPPSGGETEISRLLLPETTSSSIPSGVDAKLYTKSKTLSISLSRVSLGHGWLVDFDSCGSSTIRIFQGDETTAFTSKKSVQMYNGWRVTIDPKNNRPYYYNTKTGNRSWDLPQSLPSSNKQETSTSFPSTLSPTRDPSSFASQTSQSQPLCSPPSPPKPEPKPDNISPEPKDSKSSPMEWTVDKYMSANIGGNISSEGDQETKKESVKLGKGWYATMDLIRGKTYFYHPDSCLKQWTIPKELEEKDKKHGLPFADMGKGWYAVMEKGATRPIFVHKESGTKSLTLPHSLMTLASSRRTRRHRRGSVRQALEAANI